MPSSPPQTRTGLCLARRSCLASRPARLGQARPLPTPPGHPAARRDPHRAVTTRPARAPRRRQRRGEIPPGDSTRRKGSKFLGVTLQEAALAATRAKDSYLQAQYQRLKPRIGHRRALGAVQHSMLVAYWHMFTTGETYRELGGDYFARRDPERLTRRLVARLQSLGHNVILEPLPQAA